MIDIKKKLILLLAVLSFSVFASDISEDYDGDGLQDKVEQKTVDGNAILLSMHLSSVNKNFVYRIEPVDEQKAPSVYLDPRSGSLVVDSSYYSPQGAVYFEQYKWVLEEEKWLLMKVVTGERNDPARGVFIPTLSVERIQCCAYLGEAGEYHVQDKNQTDQEIEAELTKLFIFVKDKNWVALLRALNQVTTSEYTHYLNIKNVENLNNAAFYLSDMDDISSAILLEAIVEAFPSRVVAKLNLADVYWKLGEEIGDQHKAIELYEAYCKEMQIKGLQDKIPSHVIERISQ